MERGTGHLKLKLQGALPGLGWAGRVRGRGGDCGCSVQVQSSAGATCTTHSSSSRGDGSVLRCVVREYSPKQTLGLGKAFASFSTLSVSAIICIHWVKDLWRVPGPCSAPSGYCSMQQCGELQCCSPLYSLPCHPSSSLCIMRRTCCNYPQPAQCSQKLEQTSQTCPDRITPDPSMVGEVYIY